MLYSRKKTSSRFSDPIRRAIKPALKTALKFIAFMVPVSFAVTMLQYWGFLEQIALTLEPVFRLFGLRGEAALAMITSITMNIYSCIAVIQSIPFTVREVCIMALMALIAHNMIIETLVQMKTGSSGLQMVSIRIAGAAIGGLFLNWVLPENNTIILHGEVSENLPFAEMMQNWLMGTILLMLKLICIIVSLNILQSILEEFGVMNTLARWIAPLLRPMGLPANTAFLWIVAFVVGLAYGAAILIEHRKENKISAKDANLLNYHIAISHSYIEDTALFLAIGAPFLWITFPRLVLAIIAVWALRAYMEYKKQKNPVSSDFSKNIEQ